MPSHSDPISSFQPALEFGFSIFVFTLIVHVFLWRKFPGARQMRFLFLLFVGFPLFLSLVAVAFIGANSGALCAILSLSLSAVYVMTYPAAQAESPTLLIMIYLWRKQSCTKQEIEAYFRSKNPLEERKQDLHRDGLLRNSRPTAGGRGLIFFFTTLRRALNIKENG